MTNVDIRTDVVTRNTTAKIPFTPDLIEKILVAFEGQELLTRTIDFTTRHGDKRTLGYEKSSRRLFVETPNGRIILDANDPETYADLFLPPTAVSLVEACQDSDERLRVIAETRRHLPLGIG